MSDPDITFYRLQACPFCERVTRTLEELSVPYRSRYVEPLHSERNVVKRLTGARTVPAIVDERTGVTMAESDNIVAYLRQTYGDGASDAEETSDSTAGAGSTGATDGTDGTEGKDAGATADGGD